MNKIARRIFNELHSNKRKRPFVKSAYFGEKIFLDNFWPHLNQKNPTDRKRRLKFFECAIEFIENSKGKPIYEQKDELKKEALYRFVGRVGDRYFVIQVKADLKRGQKFLMSVFEYEA
ncbi:hypothetical protein JW752_01530 [Candidatus Peregrinibacteria bacterium]|nr:hypothetical protein [Candidatus Peregrinibacteria bacterium]